MYYKAYKEYLKNCKKEDLEYMVLNYYYNKFLLDVADYSEGNKEEDKHGHGKRIPYIGWFYRNMDFMSGKLPIGDCGVFIGFMENNKWGYPGRILTQEEFDIVVNIIDQAMELGNKGGNIAEIITNRNNKLDEIWTYMQTLKI